MKRMTGRVKSIHRPTENETPDGRGKREAERTIDPRVSHALSPERNGTNG